MVGCMRHCAVRASRSFHVRVFEALNEGQTNPRWCLRAFALGNSDGGEGRDNTECVWVGE